MGNRLKRWRALRWRDRFGLSACAAALLAMHAALALFGFRRTRRCVEALTARDAPRTAGASTIADAQALANLAAIAGRHGAVTATCLRQSLLLYGWLRWRGFNPTLQLGVLPQGGPGFEAHAWVELEGVRLLQADQGFRPFRHTAT